MYCTHSIQSAPHVEQLKLNYVTFVGLGIWTNVVLTQDTKFGPFAGARKESCEDASSAWEVSSITAAYRLDTRLHITCMPNV